MSAINVRFPDVNSLHAIFWEFNLFHLEETYQPTYVQLARFAKLIANQTLTPKEVVERWYLMNQDRLDAIKRILLEEVRAYKVELEVAFLQKMLEALNVSSEFVKESLAQFAIKLS